MYRVSWRWNNLSEIQAQTPFRYALLDRTARTARRRDSSLIAFGFGDHTFRCVLNGDDDVVRDIARTVLGCTLRTAIARGTGLDWEDRSIEPVPEGGEVEAIAWAHHAVGPAPLESPWASHRDWVGVRHASFFDPTLRRTFCPRAVHQASGGGTLPRGACDRPLPRADLSRLLRIAGAVQGMLPSDRRCFRLCAHLARKRHFHPTRVARALTLSRRRIDQLGRQHEPLLPAALAHLHDPRLAAVP